MTIHITYGDDDLIKAHDQHWWRSFRGLRFARVVLVAGLILGVFYGYLAFASGEDVTNIILSGVGGFLVVVLMLALLSLLNRYMLLPRSARKAMAQMKEYHGPWEFAIADHKLSIKTPRGEASLPFTDFLKWSEDETTVLFYRTDRLFNFLPKQQAGEEFLQGLREELAAAKIPYAYFGNS